MMRNDTSVNIKRIAGLRRLAALILAFAMTLGLLTGITPAVSAAQYSDTASHWARDAIERWSGYGVLQGVSATQFEPDRSITRAEFLAVINRAFGATATASVSNFYDVPASSWFYNDISRAIKMGTTNGTSATTMSPNAAVTRQEAVVILARALGIYADGYQTLQTFKDASLVAPYARTHVSAFVDLGYISGYDGYINPTAKLSRAEAVTILDNIFSDVTSESSTLSASRSALVRAPGTTYSGSVAGDLIIADGVGTGDIYLQNLTVSGRLVIRGGGASSVNLSGVTVKGGTFVQNPNGATRIAMTNSSVGNLTARTDVILEGSGASAVTVPSGLSGRVAITLTNADIDAVTLSSPADVKLQSGTADNVYFQPGSDGSTFDLAGGTKVASMSINASNIRVTGTGALGDVSIRASGANIAMNPKSYYIGDDLSAVIGGTTRYGRSTSKTGSNVSRQDTKLYVTQNAARTGGAGLAMNTVTSSGGNSVNVMQTINTKVPLSTVRSRMAYWVGFFIPNPGDATSAVSVTYSFDGAATTQSITQTTKDGKRGVEIMIPVTRYDDGTTRGEFDEEIFISWGSGQYETIWIRSGALELAAPTAAEEAVLISYFTNTRFSAYNGTTYTGSEALRRLLVSDNALGLNRQGVLALADSGMNNVTVKLNGERSLLTSRSAIQERLFVALAGEGAFFAINRATTAEQVKGIIELDDFGYQIGIDDVDMSKYYTLSQAGRLSVARTVLLSRGADYSSEEALVKVFLAAVDSVRQSEVTLLTNINAARTRDEMQKLIENKANNILIDIVTDSDPYKSLSADKKTYIMATIFDKKPFSSLDEIRSLFISLVGIPTVPPAEAEKVVSVTVETPTITIEVGDTATIDATVTTSTGTNEAVNYATSNDKVATVNSSGTVRGETKGSAKVTVTSAQDSTKKTTVTVNVVEPVPAKAITLSSSKLEVGEDGVVTVRATLTPANSTSQIQWSSDDDTIVTVSGDGKSATLRGVSPGMTMINARVEKEGIAAACTVTVVSKEKGVVIYPSEVTVGVGTSRQLTAVVSPISLSNRAVNWSSGDKDIVAVDPTGKITGKSEGVATITATSKYDGSLVATCKVTVSLNIKGITLSKTTMTLYRGGAETITATVVPPGSNDIVAWNCETDLATYEPIIENGREINGKITLTGNKEGKAGTFKLIASLEDDSTVTAECTVTVLSTAINITIPKTFSMNVGEEKFLNVTFSPATIENKEIEWSVDRSEYAEIDPVTGRLTAKKAGEVIVTAIPKANQTLKLTCTVTVKSIPVTSVTVPAELTIVLGDTVELPITIAPANASYSVDDIKCDPANQELISAVGTKITGKKTTYWEDDTGKVDEDGKPIRAEINHPVPVKVTVGGKSATCMVTVSKLSYTPIKMIYIKLDSWVFAVGTRQNMSVEINGGLNDEKQPSNTKVTWHSDNEGVAYVDDNGFLVCKNPGVAHITVYAWDGVHSDTKTVVVANVGLSGLLPLTGLSKDKTYGAWAGLDFGANNRAEITAQPYDGKATDKSLIWASEHPDIAKVTLDEYTGNGVVTSLSNRASGWAKITIQPYQKTKYGFVPKDTALEDLKDVVIGQTPGNMIGEYANESMLYYDSAKGFYGPNKGSDKNNVYIDPASIYDVPLVVKNEIIEGAPNSNNVFYAWVGTSTTPMAPDTQTLDFVGGTESGISVGETITLDAALNWGSASLVTWDISGPSGGLTTVTAESKTTSNHAKITLKGVTAGSYEVTVTAKVDKMVGTDGKTLQNGETFTKTYTVTVGNVAADSVAIQGATSSTVVYVTETLQLTAVFTPENATDKTVTWSSDDTNVLTVDSNGLVTAVGPGAAYITVTTSGASPKTASILLRAKDRPALEGLTLSVTGGASVVEGKSFELSVSPYPADALPGTLTWSSGNTSVAYVSGSGNLSRTIVGMGVGTATIRVTSSGGITATCEVTVTSPEAAATAGVFRISIALPEASSAPALEGVKLRSSATAIVGKPMTLTPYVTPFDASKSGLKWESSNTAVATVDNGVVVGLKAGSAKITVSDGGKIKATCTVTVKASDAKPVTSISISKKTLSLNAGASSTLSVSYKPTNATVKGVTWTSSDEKIARVEPTGKVVAVSAGTVTITATSDSGAFVATCEVTVKVPVKSVTMSDKTLKLKVGETYKLSVTVSPVDATNQTATWKSSSTSVATVSDDGTVTAKKAGTTTITVTIDGKKTTCKVTVVK